METRDFKGNTRNKRNAELRWDQVLERKLSDSLAMRDQLVESLKSEGNVSSDESEELEEGSLGGGEFRQSDSGGDEEEDFVAKSMATNSVPDTKIGPRAAQYSTSRTIQTSQRGQKRNHEGVPISVTPASTRTNIVQNMIGGPERDEHTGRETEKSRVERAKLAWISCCKKKHCSPVLLQKVRPLFSGYE